jgi:hypothetical protein
MCRLLTQSYWFNINCKCSLISSIFIPGEVSPFIFLSWLFQNAVSIKTSIDKRLTNEFGAAGGMRIGRGNQITWRKHAPVPFCPLHISHDLKWDQTWAPAVRCW